MKKILFYNDSVVFGGHEVITLHIVHDLLQSGFAISFMYDVNNQRFSKELNQLMTNFESHLTIIPINMRSGHVQGIMSFFQWWSLYRLYRLIYGNFDLICASQGDIEISSRILIVARLARIKLVSYIPGAFMPSELGLPFAWLRDKFARILYKLPNAYISISQSFTDSLRQNVSSANKPVWLLENVLAPFCKPVKVKNFSRSKVVHLGIIGAINRRKNQRFILEWLGRNPDLAIMLTLIGDGPLLEEFRKIVLRDNCLKKRVTFLGWCNDIPEQLAKLDILLIPSLIEGVPLVMLEAAVMKVPLLATDAYGMADFLPIEMRFSLNDYDGFTSKLESLLTNPSHTQNLIEQNYSKVMLYNDRQIFSQKVVAIFNSLINS